MKLLKLSAVVLLILLISCNTKKETKINSDETKIEMEVTETKTSFEDKKWKLVTFMGEDVSDKNAHITFSSEDNKVYGNSSCNNFNGSYKIEEGYQISMSQVAATRKACPDMSLETEFLKILQEVDNYSVDGSKMTLNKAKRAPFAVFEVMN